MSLRVLVRYYVLLTLLRSKRGHFTSSYSIGLTKKLISYIRLKREWKRLQRLAALAYQRVPRSCHVRRMFKNRKTYGAWYTLVPLLREQDPKEYFRFLRMTPECFDYLLEKVSPIISKSNLRRDSIPAGERLALTLRYLASGDSQRSLSYLFLISSQSISNIILETTAAIWFVLRTEVFEPLSPEFWRQKSAEFQTMWQFPMCVGAVDGKHCFVQKFPGRGSEHYNYKGFHSVVLFAVSDAKYKFIVADVGAKGRESDGGIFERSKFGQLFFEHKLGLPCPAHNATLGESLPFVFVGDDAFPLHPHMMKPFSVDTCKPEEAIFNYRLSRARRVVENAFGILSARFRILRKSMIASETLARNVILATVALHNLLLMREDGIPPNQRVYVPNGFADVYKSNGVLKPGRWRNKVKHQVDSAFHELGRQSQNGNRSCETLNPEEIREKFVELFIGDSLPWQWDLVADM